MNTLTTRNVFKPSQIHPGMKAKAATGASQPPRNMRAASAEIRIMLAYSAKKKMAKAMPEYSTIWPATISDSPSTTSKGWRFVSATPEMKYTTKMGSKGSQFQERKFRPASWKVPCCWPCTMSMRLRLPDTMSTTTSANPMASS